MIKMGNCSIKAVSDGQNPNSIRVFGGSGEAFEFNYPKLAGDILQEYPGYRIYGQSCASSPLSGDETLAGGQVYYLIPQGTNPRIVQYRKVNLQPKIQVSPLRRKNGMWKAKVVIGTKQLEEILAEEGNTEILIAQLRAAAANSAPDRKNAERYFC
ncbi:PREDICTED: uncharacterized protein LOC104813045 [Tarenaya hassleriana]|uniref:uncharacterized protein LOC104813045 n=1 Tax=Tarenaya hassleriana TaxID=28532 RepID=UPI00053C13D3|nr:PREDICTED: uncharacterized protein LOC104813045 [Tarenaya hassleriana]